MSGACEVNRQKDEQEHSGPEKGLSLVLAHQNRLRFQEVVRLERVEEGVQVAAEGAEAPVPRAEGVKSAGRMEGETDGAEIDAECGGERFRPAAVTETLQQLPAEEGADHRAEIGVDQERAAAEQAPEEQRFPGGRAIEPERERREQHPVRRERGVEIHAEKERRDEDEEERAGQPERGFVREAPQQQCRETALQQKTAQPEEPEILEPFRQISAEQLERQGEKRNRVGVDDRGVMGIGEHIGQPGREMPGRIPEGDPAEIVLGRVAAAEQPGGPLRVEHLPAEADEEGGAADERAAEKSPAV